MIFTSRSTPLGPSLLLIMSSWLLRSSHFSKDLVSAFLSLSITSDWQLLRLLSLSLFLSIFETRNLFKIPGFINSASKMLQSFLANESPCKCISFVIDNLITVLCPFSNQYGDNLKSTMALRQFPWKQLITCWPTLPILRQSLSCVVVPWTGQCVPQSGRTPNGAGAGVSHSCSRHLCWDLFHSRAMIRWNDLHERKEHSY